MGEIDIIPESGNATSYSTAGTTTTNSSTIEPVTNKSISMIDWQYQMQKKLQKPLISSHGMEKAEQASYCRTRRQLAVEPKLPVQHLPFQKEHQCKEIHHMIQIH